MFIDGSWQEARSGAQFEITDPATGEIIGSVPDGGRDDAEEAIAAADEAFAAWSTTTARSRADLLYRAWQLMSERSETLAELMTREQGKPLKASRAEVAYAADFLRFYAEEATRVTGEWLPSARADQRFLVLRQPVGVVAMVTPWNYPISMLTRKMAPALAAGCTLALKPAEATPLCARAVFEIFADVETPPGVVNLVTARDPKPIGEVFTTDPRVRKLTFTGSTVVGRHLAGVAAGNLKRVSVELGGHAPFVVFPDADPVRAAKGAAALKFLNAGQACISPNRLYVHESHHDAFVSTLVERVGRVRAGNGFDEGVGVGPLVNEAAVAKVAAQVDDAVGQGAEALVGGTRLTDAPFDRGHFYAPTLLDGIRDGMSIYREETFGPVAPVVTYDDVDQVVDLANDTSYGLAAYVYTQDLSTAIRAFEGLRFGIVGVNDVNPTAASAPFGGMGDSGIGREGSHDGIAEYLETKLGGSPSDAASGQAGAMRLATIRTDVGTTAVRIDLDAGRAIETGHGDVGALLAVPGWTDVAASADGPPHDLDGADYAPLITAPQKVICVGLNYLDHIAETGRERPEYPTLFPKFANTLIGANDAISLPLEAESTSVDWEAELGLVIGTPVRRATPEQAAAAIAGYTVVNDVSVRDYQRHTAQFMPGKAWEHTTPVGPHLVTAEPGTPADFPISCEVDGEVMQSSNTRELCFGPVDLVRYISTFTTLVPGDLIVTGTPGGVGMARTPPVFLRSGQTVVTRIDGIGECRNICA